MIIKEVSHKDWKYFHLYYPLYRLPENEFAFQRDCVFNCRPTADRKSLGYYSGEELAGIVNFQRTVVDDTPILYVYSMAVHPDWRRKGIASLLLESVAEQAGNEQHLVMFPASAACKSLAQSLGFEDNPAIKLYPEDMVKVLFKAKALALN